MNIASKWILTSLILFDIYLTSNIKLHIAVQYWTYSVRSTCFVVFFEEKKTKYSNVWVSINITWIL